MTLAAGLCCGLAVLCTLLVPRRYALVPLLFVVTLVPRGQSVGFGGIDFTVQHLVVAAVMVRAAARRDAAFSGSLGTVDALVALGAVWLLLSGLFHAAGQITNHARLCYETLGLYFGVRLYCRTVPELHALLRASAWLLGLLAVAMVAEAVTLHNVFSVFSGIYEVPWIRNGSVRAEGPFANPIMAGNVGAVSLPLMAALSRSNRRHGLLGMSAAVAVVGASASSGPLVSLAVAIAGLLFWPYRAHVRTVALGLLALYPLLAIVMQAPPYYLIGRIDLVGGSAGWHRARLIETALEHLPEWWLVGTDYTRHWMPTGVQWSEDHTDITNHFILLGVYGGVGLIVLFAAALAGAFAAVGRRLRSAADAHGAFLHWTCGVSLATHMATCLAVAYLDHSIAFLYVTLVACQVRPVVAPVLVRAAEPRRTPRLRRGRRVWRAHAPVVAAAALRRRQLED